MADPYYYYQPPPPPLDPYYYYQPPPPPPLYTLTPLNPPFYQPYPPYPPPGYLQFHSYVGYVPTYFPIWPPQQQPPQPPPPQQQEEFIIPPHSVPPNNITSGPPSNKSSANGSVSPNREGESLATSGRKRKARQDQVDNTNDVRLNLITREFTKPPEIEIDQVVDMKAMLSSNNRDYLVSSKDGAIVPLSSLDGKYVIICRFTAPFEDRIRQSLEALYSELSLQWINHLMVKFVILLDDDDLVSNPSAFHSFFQALSFNCLTIPLSDYDSCRRICRSLLPRGFINVSCLAIHTSGRVLQNCSDFLYRYGAESFPFSQKQFEMIRLRDQHIRYCISNTASPITLEELLHCDSLPLVADPNNFIKTSSLRNKPVGLYLYHTGQFLDEFLDIHQQCRNKGLDFEFILVPMPFGTRHPDSFFSDMNQSVLTSCPTTSWLTFPFNDKICRTLWRLHGCAPFEQLVIMPHAGHAGDIEGRSILRRYGIESYPFTSDVIVEKKVTRLRSRTLQSLLGDDTGLDISDKNVILYLVGTHASSDYNYSRKTIKRKFCEITKLFPDTQIYTVPLRSVSCHLSELGFNVLPEEKCQSVIDHIFMTNDPVCSETVQETVVAFGKEGKILSRHLIDYVPAASILAASIFDDTLHGRIWAQIQQEINKEY